MNSKVGFTLLIAAFPVCVLAQDTESIRMSAPLSVDAPFRESIDSKLEVETTISFDGKIAISVILRDIEVQDTGESNIAPPETTMREDWRATFLVVPRLSASDRKKIDDAFAKYRLTSKGQTTPFVGKQQFLPDVVSADFAYHISSQHTVPVNLADWKIVRDFSQRLAKKLTLPDGSDCRNTLNYKLLP